ncbi:MAG: DNA methyltransferase [Planctomycetota bacterium]|jgi:DNA modification methylase
MPEKLPILPNLSADKLTKAALDRRRVAGLTHNFYKYPARFSPAFASTAIDLFSKPGDVVTDPYMGGGTTIVEAMVAGRHAIGADLNSLSLFLTRVKTTSLTSKEKESLSLWAEQFIPKVTYRHPAQNIAHLLLDTKKTRNLNLAKARFVKKFVAAALSSLNTLQGPKAMDFARCAVLKTAQWALDGRKSHTSLKEFRHRLKQNVNQMLVQLGEFENSIGMQKLRDPRRILVEIDTAFIDQASVFSEQNVRADLVVTSPPYPGLHVLYHRWQVDGRRETPAPYWIAGCEDGQGDSYYSFGSRKQSGLHSYFEKSMDTLRAIRRIMRPDAYMVQMIAFSDPQNQLPRYLANMKTSGFKEVLLYNPNTSDARERIWRTVPNRKWHATLRGRTSGSREAVLIHKAI